MTEERFDRSSFGFGCVILGAAIGALFGLAAALAIKFMPIIMPKMMARMMPQMIASMEEAEVEPPCAHIIRGLLESQREEEQRNQVG